MKNLMIIFCLTFMIHFQSEAQRCTNLKPPAADIAMFGDPTKASNGKIDKRLAYRISKLGCPNSKPKKVTEVIAITKEQALERYKAHSKGAVLIVIRGWKYTWDNTDLQDKYLRVWTGKGGKKGIVYDRTDRTKNELVGRSALGVTVKGRFKP